MEAGCRAIAKATGPGHSGPAWSCLSSAVLAIEIEVGVERVLYAGMCGYKKCHHHCHAGILIVLGPMDPSPVGLPALSHLRHGWKQAKLATDPVREVGDQQR